MKNAEYLYSRSQSGIQLFGECTIDGGVNKTKFFSLGALFRN